MSTAEQIGRALAARRRRRSWTVPYGDVSSLFDKNWQALRDDLGIPDPIKAIVYRNKSGVTVTAHASSETMTFKTSVMIPIGRTSR